MWRCGVDVLIFAALGKGAAAAEQDGELVIEVIAEPVGDAGAGLQTHGFPGLP